MIRARIGCSLINRSYLPFFFLTLPLRFEADGREGIYCILGCFLPITYSKTISFHQRVSMIFSYLLKQSITLSFLTLQPTPSIPFLQQSSLSPPYLDAYSSICFPVVMARIREKMLFILFFVFFLNGATRGKAQLSTLPQKGGRFLLSKNASSAIRAQQAAELCSKASFHSSKSSIWFEAPCSIRRESPQFFDFERKYTSVGGLRRRNAVARLKGEDAELPFWLSSARKLDSD